MRIIFIVIGFISFGLGTIGIFLPILPTVPFYMLAGFCFAKSSERLENWLKGTKFYKDNVEGFTDGKGLTKARKTKIILTVTVVMGISAYFMRNTKYGLIILGTVWICHAIALVFIVKTKEENMDKLREGIGEINKNDDK